MGVPSYLLKKQDTYYFRQACNRDFKQKIGKREIVKSLGVKDKSVAIRMAREFKVNVDHLVDHLALDGDFDRTSITHYIDQSLRSIKSRYGKLNRSHREISSILSLPSPPPTSTSSSPKTQLQTNSTVTLTSLEKKTELIPLFEQYSGEKFKLKQWAEKTQKERTAHFILLHDLLKHTTKQRKIYIEDIAKEHVRAVKDLLLILPKHHIKRFPHISLSKLIEKCTLLERGDEPNITVKQKEWMLEKISINTIVDKYVSTIKGFWKWLNDQEYTDSRIFDILKYDYKKTTNSWKSYTNEDLTVLFDDKIYNRLNSKFPYQYFVPIISLYTSCRLQEICQLRTCDVVDIDGTHILKVVDSDTTSVKSINSQRSVPIHEGLISSGFLSYVNEQIEKGELFIFPELKNKDKTTNIKRVSKWFNERYRVKKGFEKGYSFHSLRRSFINEMSRNGASDSEIRSIIGHKPIKSDTLNNHYKDEMSILQKKQLMDKYIVYKGCNFPWL